MLRSAAVNDHEVVVCNEVTCLRQQDPGRANSLLDERRVASSRSNERSSCRQKTPTAKEHDEGCEHDCEDQASEATNGGPRRLRATRAQSLLLSASSLSEALGRSTPLPNVGAEPRINASCDARSRRKRS